VVLDSGPGRNHPTPGGRRLNLARRLPGDRISKPERVVCLDAENRPLPRVSEAHADLLVRRGWAEIIGNGTRRHLRLTDLAPTLATAPGCGDGTRAVRASGRSRPDGTPSVYKPQQFIGNPHVHREHILAD
jgi:hypothetical protein